MSQTCRFVGDVSCYVLLSPPQKRDDPTLHTPGLGKLPEFYQPNHGGNANGKPTS